MESVVFEDKRSYVDGEEYKGTMLNGLRSGIGLQTFKDGSVYIGNFAKGLPHGMGMFNFSNGSQFKGEFEKGLLSGLGMYHTQSGDVLKGIFKHGKLNGHGIYEFADGGESSQGIFEEGTLVCKADCSYISKTVADTVMSIDHHLSEFTKMYYSKVSKPTVEADESGS